jgi:hypothetical protein
VLGGVRASSAAVIDHANIHQGDAAEVDAHPVDEAPAGDGHEGVARDGALFGADGQHLDRLVVGVRAGKIHAVTARLHGDVDRAQIAGGHGALQHVLVQALAVDGATRDLDDGLRAEPRPRDEDDVAALDRPAGRGNARDAEPVRCGVEVHVAARQVCGAIVVGRGDVDGADRGRTRHGDREPRPVVARRHDGRRFAAEGDLGLGHEPAADEVDGVSARQGPAAGSTASNWRSS